MVVSLLRGVGSSMQCWLPTEGGLFLETSVLFSDLVHAFFTHVLKLG